MGERLTAAAAAFLVSPEGRRWAARLAAARGDDLTRLKRLRRDLDADRAAALVDQERGRKSLAPRHPNAERVFTTARAAEQASSWTAATWRARRFADAGLVADLGCGIGVDARALAEVADVVAVDASLPRLILARANLAGAPRGAQCVLARCPAFLPRVPFGHCDPDRRPAGRRETDPERASPPLGRLLSAAARMRGLGVKLSPLADLDRLPGAAEVELVSIGGELKEIVLWTGELVTGARRVSRPDAGFSMTLAATDRLPPVVEPGSHLLSPDPALVRSGLLRAFAHEQGLALIDPEIAYLTGSDAAAHPLLTSWIVDAVLPPAPRGVTRYLRHHGIGRVTASRRGFAVAPDEFVAGLRPQGDGAAHLHLTRARGRPVVIVTRRAGGS